MLGIGFWEMLVIAGLILIAVGPDRLPAMVKTVSKFYRQFRRTAEDLRASTGIDDLMRDEELKELAELRKQKLALLGQTPNKAPAKSLPNGKPVPAPTPPKSVATPDAGPGTAVTKPATPIEDPGHAMVGSAIPRTRAVEAPRQGLSDKERALEVPPEGVDVFEARRFEPELSEDELMLRKARITAKTTGRPVEEILAEEAARAAGAGAS